MQTCSKCGTVAPGPAPFCSVCGASLVVGGVMPAIPPPPIATKTSGFAIAGFVLSFVCGVLGLIFSLLGYSEAKKSNGRITGEGFALAGIIISIVSIVGAILMWWLMFRTIDEIGKLVDETGPRIELRTLGTRAQQYYLEHGEYPKFDVPATTACCDDPDQRCAQDWNAPEWRALDFRADSFSNRRYRYGYRSTPSGFEAMAVGDSDCDGDEVTFTLRVEPGGRVSRESIQRSGQD